VARGNPWKTGISVIKEVKVMGVYRLYYVGAARIKPGQGQAAARWWNEKGKAFFEAQPGTKSVRVYAVQFGLGGEYSLEFWSEIEDYASLDRLDEDILANPRKYAAWLETQEILEWGPARLMGDWPESRFPMGESEGA